MSDGIRQSFTDSMTTISADELARLTRERDFYKAQADVTHYVERTDALMRERDEAYGAIRGLNKSIDLLKAERDEARAERALAEKACREAVTNSVEEENRARQAEAERDRLRALLREVEWRCIVDNRQTNSSEYGNCPSCYGRWPDHAPDCRLAAALEAHP